MSYTQAARPLAVETALGPDAVLLTALEGEEGVSTPFRFALDLASDRRHIDPAAVLGKPACVRIARPDEPGERLIHGLVTRFRHADQPGARANYHAELAPWLWMLSLSADCRIYQGKSAPEIVTGLFDELGYRDYRVALVKGYAPREYCVQYRETHLAFVSRLLEDEGIRYYFEHHEDKHVLVLADSPAATEACPDLPPLRSAPPDAAAWRGDVYTALLVDRAVQTARVALADYNPATPSTSLHVSLGDDGERPEVFDYPGRYADVGEGERAARLRLEAAEALREVAHLTTAAPTATPGYKAEITGTAAGAWDGAWAVLSVTHSARQGGYGAGEPDAGFAYENRLTAVRATVPYRPPRRTPRPRVRGTQSALVVGKAGEEIWTDAQGRVKLHFYWDRRSRRDEHSSCWVRCSAAWAGKGWGQFSVPRIGQEVLVDFLEGDPDRPVVVGRVYNAEQPPPCNPAGGGVVSGMRSKTHKGAGYNAMELDDTAGKEKISIHAQYDMDTTVQHDDTQTVVSGNRKIDVKAGTHTETIKGDTTVTVTTGAYKRDVQTGGATIHVKGAVAENFDDSQTTTVAHHVKVDGGDSITLVSGDSTIALFKDGTIKVHCKNLEVIGDVSIKASAPKVEVLGGDEAKLGVGNQQVTCDKAKVSVSGAAINATAIGTHEITGALVKIN